jgi:hypothetical protein
MSESQSHAWRRVQRRRAACLAAQGLRVAGWRNAQAQWRAPVGGLRGVGNVLQVQCHGWAGLSVRRRSAQCSDRGGSAMRARAQSAQRCNACARGSIGGVAHAEGCMGSAHHTRARIQRRGFANAVLFAQAWPAVTANPSIERTPYGTLRVPAVAAHVELQGLPHLSSE